MWIKKEHKQNYTSPKPITCLLKILQWWFISSWPLLTWFMMTWPGPRHMVQLLNFSSIFSSTSLWQPSLLILWSLGPKTLWNDFILNHWQNMLNTLFLKTSEDYVGYTEWGHLILSTTLITTNMYKKERARMQWNRISNKMFNSVHWLVLKNTLDTGKKENTSFQVSTYNINVQQHI